MAIKHQLLFLSRHLIIWLPSLLVKSASVFSLLVIVVAGSACSRVIYQPSPRSFYAPERLGLHYEDVFFQSKDGTRLHGWFFPVPPNTKERGLVVQFHGNAQNISSHFITLSWIVEHGYHLFTFDYRGYGRSEGSPSQAKVHQDAVAALAYAVEWKRSRVERLNTHSAPQSAHPPEADGESRRANINAQFSTRVEESPQQAGGFFNAQGSAGEADLKLVAYGQSLGGAVLLRALNDLPQLTLIDVVVVEGAFPSYQQIAREKLAVSWVTWPFQYLADILFSDRYAPERFISNVAPIPLLVIHGVQDPVVPIRHGRNVYRLASPPKWFWEIEDGGHIDAMTSHGEKYRTRLLNFLDQIDTPTSMAPGPSRVSYWSDYRIELAGLSREQIATIEESLRQLRSLQPGKLAIDRQVYKQLSRFEELFGFPFNGEELFYWLMSRIRKISYQDTWTVGVNQNAGEFILEDAFFEDLTVLERLYLLIHEAQHSDGDGYPHVKCPKGFNFISARQPDMNLEKEFACDEGNRGAYAVQAAFLFELYAYGLFDQNEVGLLYNSSISRVVRQNR